MTKTKKKIFFIVSITLFSLATLLLTIVNNNPFKSENIVFITFFLSFFTTIFGISILVISFVKSRFIQNNSMISNFTENLRQSILLATITTVLLGLKGLGVLDLWVSIPLAIAIILLEMYFHGITKDKKYV